MADYFVSPANGSDSTGAGTLASPWKSVQHVFDTVTQGTDGDVIHVQAGAPDVLAAPFDLTSYGASSLTKVVVISGYTSVAYDGGQGEIDGDGTYPIFDAASSGNWNNVVFRNMKLGNCGSARVISFYRFSSLINCELYGSTADSPIRATDRDCAIIGCDIHDMSPATDVINRFYLVQNNAMRDCIATSARATGVIRECRYIIDNILDLRGGNQTGIRVGGADVYIVTGNTIVSGGAHSAVGIVVTANTSTAFVVNNIIAGYSGASGIGLHVNNQGVTTIHGGNAFYNCATNETIYTRADIRVASSVSLASDPFVDAANDDFRLKDASLAAGAAWPPSWPGLSSTTNARDIGAAQNALTIDYPIEADVRLGVDYAEAAKTGTLAVPVAGNVRAGVAVDNTTGTLGIPTVGNVRSDVQYGAANTEYTGVLELPLSGNVLAGVQYGASGTEYTGTMPQTLSIGEGAEIDIIDDLITVEVND